MLDRHDFRVLEADCKVSMTTRAHLSSPKLLCGVTRTLSKRCDFAVFFCVTLRSLLSGIPMDTPTTRAASTTLKECHEGTYACNPLTLICRDCVTVDGLDEVLCWPFRTDNSGPPEDIDEVFGHYAIAQSQFPGAEVSVLVIVLHSD